MSLPGHIANRMSGTHEGGSVHCTSAEWRRHHPGARQPVTGAQADAGRPRASRSQSARPPWTRRAAARRHGHRSHLGTLQVLRGRLSGRRRRRLLACCRCRHSTLLARPPCCRCRLLTCRRRWRSMAARPSRRRRRPGRRDRRRQGLATQARHADPPTAAHPRHGRRRDGRRGRRPPRRRGGIRIRPRWRPVWAVGCSARRPWRSPCTGCPAAAHSRRPADHSRRRA